MTDEYRNRLKSFTAKGILLLAVGFGYFLFIKLTGWGLPCPVYTLTGSYCPGCGITRMCIALLEFDLPRAFQSNALVLILLPFALIFGGRRAVLYIKTGKSDPDRLETVLLIIAAILTAAFWILRNQPAFSFLAPI